MKHYPFGEDGLIVIDPERGYGNPIVERKGCATHFVYDMYLAEGELLAPVMDWFGITEEEVLAAARYEETYNADEWKDEKRT